MSRSSHKFKCCRVFFDIAVDLYLNTFDTFNLLIVRPLDQIISSLLYELYSNQT